MDDKLTGIAAFVQAVDSGSFAVAAERMNLTRSAVAKRVARLERRLGARLFHRTTRRQSLTEDGQSYYERCVRALAELDAAEATLDSGRREPRGRLRVSAPVLFGRHCVAPVLMKLAQQHPQLQVEISFSDRVADLLEEGIDLAVRIGPLPDSTHLAARRLGTQRMGIGASPAYLAQRGRPENAEALDGHACIVYGRAGQDLRWKVRDGDGVREPRMDVKLRMDDVQAIADAAIAGVGLAWLPCWMLSHYLASGELECVMGHELLFPNDVHAVWPQSRYLPSKTRVAIDALVEEIPKLIGK